MSLSKNFPHKLIRTVEISTSGNTKKYNSICSHRCRSILELGTGKIITPSLQALSCVRGRRPRLSYQIHLILVVVCVVVWCICFAWGEAMK
jgi:predicted nucleic acid-binding Zn ribbon protein